MTNSTDSATEATPGHVVRVSRTVPVPLDRVWQTLSTPAGSEALLGTGAVLGGKGEPWRSTDGRHGVVRSYHPFEQIRVSWHDGDDDPTHIVDLHLTGEGDGTRLDISHDRVADDADDAAIERHWDEALHRLEQMAVR